MFKADNEYTEAELMVDKSGMSKYERDEALKADMKRNPSAFINRPDFMNKKKRKKITGFKV